MEKERDKGRRRYVDGQRNRGWEWLSDCAYERESARERIIVCEYKWEKEKIEKENLRKTDKKWTERERESAA